MTRNTLPNNWQIKTLGEIVTDIRYGMTASADFINDGVKFLRVTDITENGSVDYSKLPHVVAKKNEAERYFLDNGDCIIARSGSVGKAHIFYGSEKIVFASYLIRLRFNKSIIHPSYFGAFSRTKSYWNQITSNTKGGVQQNINTEGLSRIQIPLPPLPIQKQIAEILEKADEARQKRKEANKLTDEFLQSVFIEMFGDPVKNPKGWDYLSLIDICLKITDGTHNTPKRLKAGIKFITGKNIRPFYIDFTELDFVSEDIHKEIYRRCNPIYGDILYTNIGINVGTAVMNNLHEEFSMKNVALLKGDANKINSRFLEHLLNNQIMKSSVLNTFSIGGAQSFLSLNNIKRIRIPVPPLSLQKQFAEIVNKTEALKEKQKQSEQELENLFQSLMQKAFKGELVA